ncbi:hypothetical protein ABK040_008554 [Willaertia magna]
MNKLIHLVKNKQQQHQSIIISQFNKQIQCLHYSTTLHTLNIQQQQENQSITSNDNSKNNKQQETTTLNSAAKTAEKKSNGEKEGSWLVETLKELGEEILAATLVGVFKIVILISLFLFIVWYIIMEPVKTLQILYKVIKMFYNVIYNSDKSDEEKKN